MSPFEYKDPIKYSMVDVLTEEISKNLSHKSKITPLNFNKLLSTEIKNIESDQMKYEVIVQLPDKLFPELPVNENHSNDTDKLINDAQGTISIANASQDSKEKSISIKIKYYLNNPTFGAFFKKSLNYGHQFYTYNHYGMARYWIPCFDSQKYRCKWNINILNLKYPLQSVSVGRLLESVRQNSNNYCLGFGFFTRNLLFKVCPKCTNFSL